MQHVAQTDTLVRLCIQTLFAASWRPGRLHRLRLSNSAVSVGRRGNGREKCAKGKNKGGQPHQVCKEIDAYRNNKRTTWSGVQRGKRSIRKASQPVRPGVDSNCKGGYPGVKGAVRPAQNWWEATWRWHTAAVETRKVRHVGRHSERHTGSVLSLIHIWRCRRSTLCRSRWSPYH